MPLNTSIIRNGEMVPLRWDNFHVASMALAASFDAEFGVIGAPEKVYEVDPRMFECYPDAPFPVTRQMAFMLTGYGALSKTPLNDGHYILTKRQHFIDVTDGEILALLPGDELNAYRGW